MGHVRTKINALKTVCCLFLLGALSCGETAQKGGGGDRYQSKTMQAFEETARDYEIPVRFMLAVAKVESHLNPKASLVDYGGSSIGPKAGQTAFGLTRGELGIPLGSGGDSLASQVRAYGKWLSHNKGNLKNIIEGDEDKFLWLWNIAGLHRDHESSRALFAKELIYALNSGFKWLDPETKDIIEFAKESPAIDVNNLRTVSQNHLQLVNLTRYSTDNVRSARQVVLRNHHNHGKEQKPNGILVVHCPFSFSACVEMQAFDGVEEREFWLGAHFIIPKDEGLSEFPLQAFLHKDAVPYLDGNGEKSLRQDKIVIMLTGHGGSISAGKRLTAEPNWMNNWQLQRMGELVRDVCDRLSRDDNPDDPDDGGISFNDCVTVGKGTQFQYQGDRDEYLWGDILDFDRSIFKSYVEFPNALSGKAVFEYPDGKQIFEKEEEIALNLTFELKVHYVELERLIRCKNGKVKWRIIDDADPMGQELEYMFSKLIRNSGPNLNGTHFFRAKAFGRNGNLLGWDLAQVYLKGYNNDNPVVTPGMCE